MKPTAFLNLNGCPNMKIEDFIALVFIVAIIFFAGVAIGHNIGVDDMKDQAIQHRKAHYRCSVNETNGVTSSTFAWLP